MDLADLHVGIDIIEIVRIRSTLRRFGDRFLNKHFTGSEIDYCQAKPRPAESLAARFAAKEAFAKAYPGNQTLAWKDVEVVMDGDVPGFKLRNVASRYKAKLSLSHTHSHALAIVLLSSLEEEA